MPFELPAVANAEQRMQESRVPNVNFRGFNQPLTIVRINDTYSTPDMAADLLEHDIKKLNLLYQRGGESFGKHEDELKALLASGGHRGHI